MSHKASVSVFALVCASACLPASAGTVVLEPGSGWQTFAVDSMLAPAAAPLRWIDDAGTLLDFTFKVEGWQRGLLTVVDGGFAGDRFSIAGNGQALGSTSPVAMGSFEASAYLGLDFDAALADASFSRGLFSFAPGNYSLGGTLIQSVTLGGFPLEATVGALRLDVVAVPEPPPISLVLLALVAAAAWVRRNS